MTEQVFDFKCQKCGKKFRTKDKTVAKKAICKVCRMPDFLPIPSGQAEEFPARCFCRKTAQFSSTLLNQVFCSEKCYDEARERHDRAEQLPQEQKPHIHFTAKGEAIFVCAEVGFQVDSKDLNKAIGTNGEHSKLDSLMDSQLAAIAHAVGINTSPFVRDLLLIPLRGLVQLTWYRDIYGHTSEHLENNQKKRVDKYNSDLLDWSPDGLDIKSQRVGHNRPRAPRVSAKSIALSASYVAVQGSATASSIASGRESDLLKAVQTFKGKSFTFAELSVAAKNFLQTKQDWDMICLRFLKELIVHGAVKGA
jgi:hypothetical protein